MEPITHEIDPNADTIIILSNALVNFALWDYEEVKIPSNNTSDHLSDDSRIGFESFVVKPFVKKGRKGKK